MKLDKLWISEFKNLKNLQIMQIIFWRFAKCATENGNSTSSFVSQILKKNYYGKLQFKSN